MNDFIDVQNDDNYPVDISRLQQAALATLYQLDIDESSALSIVLVDDDNIQSLNRQFRDVDAPTDVLSFPADMPLGLSGADMPYLGDLVIAYPYVVAQAQHEGSDVMHNLELMVVHGTLHLLGYDHDTPENRAGMWAVQAQVLEALGVPVSIVPGLERYAADH